MTRNSIGIAALLLTACGFGAAKADDITASGNPGPLIISSATAGSALAPVSNATTTYNIEHHDRLDEDHGTNHHCDAGKHGSESPSRGA